jgi:K+-sensing histidine kinase KdpD
MEETLEKIHQAGLKLLAPMTLETTYETAVKEAMQLVNASYGSLILLEGGELKRVYSTLPAEHLVTIRKTGSTHTAFQTQKALATYDFGQYHPSIASLGVKANVFIPLVYKGNSLGVLITNSLEDKQYTKQELHILQLFGSIVSLAIVKTQLYHEASDALKSRDQLISLVAHELRTPLTTISGYMQLLQNKLKGSDSNEARWVEESVLQTYRLSKLINQMLDVSHIKSDTMHFDWEHCHLKTVIDTCVKEFQQFFPNRHLEVINTVSAAHDQLIADCQKLQNVIVNLLDNAAKYSPPDAKICIVIKKRGNIISIAVQDFGKGMAQVDLDSLFNEFYKGTTTSKENTGVGMGLFLAKFIINQHHGELNMKSKVGKGTTATIKLKGLKP